MWAVFLSHSPAHSQVRYMWDILVVLHLLHSSGSVSLLILCQFMLCTLALIVIFSCCRISDFFLLGCKESLCVLSASGVTLQCTFGLEQAHWGYRSHQICPHMPLDEELCPVHCIQLYRKATSPFHSSDAMFVATVPRHFRCSTCMMLHLCRICRLCCGHWCVPGFYPCSCGLYPSCSGS